jgi:hypothetical protein
MPPDRSALVTVSPRPPTAARAATKACCFVGDDELEAAIRAWCDRKLLEDRAEAFGPNDWAA